MLIAFAFGQFFDWRFVAFRTILAGGNPKFPALVALDPDAVLVYPAVLYFADAVRHGTQTMCSRDPALADRLTERTARAADRKAVKDAREEKAETKSRETERSQQAELEAALQAERVKAEGAQRERELEAKRKVARDARYAARKSRSKRR